MKRHLQTALVIATVALLNASCERQDFSETKRYHSRMGDAHKGEKAAEHSTEPAPSEAKPH